MTQDTKTYMGDIVGVGIIGGAQGVVVTAADPIYTGSEGAAQMSPDDARALAARLVDAADECDRQRKAQGSPAFPSQTR